MAGFAVTGRLALVIAGAVALSGCEEGQGLEGFFAQKPEAEGGQSASDTPRETRIVERDVEAPDVYSSTDKGLWDGRPSLGGVWVAADDANDPERVIIRNEDNGKFVIGALFKRERSNPGPALQVSSDAAEALGMLAGSPATLNVIALRHEEVVEEIEAPVLAETIAAPEAIEAAPIESDPITSLATSAIEAADPAPVAATPPAPKPTPAPAASSALSKPYIQIGIFSVEANAKRTADMMRKAGVTPTIKPGNSSGKAFWRVIVGPAASSAERADMLKKVKAAGFADAYFVTN